MMRPTICANPHAVVTIYRTSLPGAVESLAACKSTGVQKMYFCKTARSFARAPLRAASNALTYGQVRGMPHLTVSRFTFSRRTAMVAT